MKVKQIIFDFGGVLVEWNPQKIVGDYTSDVELQSRLMKNVFEHSDWLELDRGILCEVEAAQRISKRIGVSNFMITNLFEAVRKSFNPIISTVELLEELVRFNIPCYGLSNMSLENFEFLKSKYLFFEKLNGIVISANEQTIKPEIDIYNKLIERYRLKPNESLFIDDTLQNCLAAEDAGMRSMHFNRDEITMDVLRNKL